MTQIRISTATAALAPSQGALVRFENVTPAEAAPDNWSKIALPVSTNGLTS